LHGCVGRQKTQGHPQDLKIAGMGRSVLRPYEEEPKSAGRSNVATWRKRLFEERGGVLEDRLHDVGENVGFVDFKIVDAMAGGIGLCASLDGLFQC